MNDKEKQLFRQALSQERPALPADFTRQVLERIARERAQREQRTERRMLVAAVAITGLAVAAAAAALWFLGPEMSDPLRQTVAAVRQSFGVVGRQLSGPLLLLPGILALICKLISIPLSRWVSEAAEKN